jgi:hypothetical protein
MDVELYTKYKPLLYLISGQMLCGSHKKKLPLWLNEKKGTKSK